MTWGGGQGKFPGPASCFSVRWVHGPDCLEPEGEV